MHIIDRADWETGRVYDWKDKDEADDMGINHNTLRDWRQTLDKLNYIHCIQKQYSQEIVIYNWINPRNYSGEIINQFSQGDVLATPQGDVQGDVQGSRKDGTPTYSSLSHTSRKEEAKKRIAKQRAKKKEPLDFLIENADKIQAQAKMRERVEKAMRRHPDWDSPRSDWNGYEKLLIEREKETGQTIEQFMGWYNSDEFRKKGVIYLTRTKIEDYWLQAFDNKWTPIPDVEKTKKMLAEKDEITRKATKPKAIGAIMEGMKK